MSRKVTIGAVLGSWKVVTLKIGGLTNKIL